MTKLHKTTIAFLLAAALLMTGCAEHSNILAPDADTNTNTSSDISDSNSSESTDNSSESSGSSNNSTSTKSESSSSDTSDSVSESESSTESDSNSEESSDTSDYTIPIELTDEDKELQGILEDLLKGENAICGWFICDRPIVSWAEMDSEGNLVQFSQEGVTVQEYEFFFPEMGVPATYYLMPDNYSENGMFFPQTYEEIKEIALEYYSERVVDNIMYYWIGKGSMTEKPDGTLEVTLDENCSNDWYKLLEIDGKMYRLSGDGGRGLGFRALEPNTAKIVSKTDNAIEFTYLLTNWLYYDFDDGTYKEITDESQYTKTALTGVLKYERGGWRRDWDKDDPRRD